LEGRSGPIRGLLPRGLRLPPAGRAAPAPRGSGLVEPNQPTFNQRSIP